MKDEELGMIDVLLKEMSIKTVQTWEDPLLNQAATVAVWIETSEKIKALISQALTAERVKAQDRVTSQTSIANTAIHAAISKLRRKDGPHVDEAIQMLYKAIEVVTELRQVSSSGEGE